jgi:phosphoglycerate dehydrogenase-like enzyme
MELLVTGAFSGAKHHIRELEEKGHRVHFLQFEKDELPCPPDQIEGVICNGLFLFHAIESFTRLRFIQLTSAGYDRVPMDYVKANGIQIYNARGVYSIPMAEAAVAGVLNLYRKMYVFRENQKRHVWEKQRDLLEVYGKTVCIFGCGSVGSECAKRFAAFGARVVGVDAAASDRTHCAETDGNDAGHISRSKFPWFEDVFTPEKAECLLSESDIVICTLPLTESTRHYFGAERFGRMQPGAVFVNISRGGTVDTAALAHALAGGGLGGAVLDVFEEEPLGAESPLWDMENVIITPHNSFVGDGNEERLWGVMCRNLDDWKAKCQHAQ